jgi:hypothetical protein
MEFADKLIHSSVANCCYLMNQAACILLSEQLPENSGSPRFNLKNLRLCNTHENLHHKSWPSHLMYPLQLNSSLETTNWKQGGTLQL